MALLSPPPHVVNVPIGIIILVHYDDENAKRYASTPLVPKAKHINRVCPCHYIRLAQASRRRLLPANLLYRAIVDLDLEIVAILQQTVLRDNLVVKCQYCGPCSWRIKCLADSVPAHNTAAIATIARVS